MSRQIPLCYLSPGTKAIVSEIKSNNADIKRRLQDMGFVKGTVVECVFESPLGDPVAYHIKGTMVALRIEESSMILVE